MTYASVLVPLDGSHLAAEAIPQAIAIARRHGAHLILLNVLTEEGLPASADVPYHSPTREQDAQRSQAEGYLEGMKRQVQRAGVSVETRIEQGAAAATVIKVARSLESPVIVMTSHGKTASHAKAVDNHAGTVTEEIVRDWDGACLVVDTAGGAA